MDWLRIELSTGGSLRPSIEKFLSICAQKVSSDKRSESGLAVDENQP
jgi:hypothetical protein